mmetsp:Transcript_7691/g.18773  ORF Transcript_7691/g.18773 Transcript_7691/m.18773 type:complete len:266 (-) Transcript_7691:375-1172(-)
MRRDERPDLVALLERLARVDLADGVGRGIGDVKIPAGQVGREPEGAEELGRRPSAVRGPFGTPSDNSAHPAVMYHSDREVPHIADEDPSVHRGVDAYGVTESRLVRRAVHVSLARAARDERGHVRVRVVAHDSVRLRVGDEHEPGRIDGDPHRRVEVLHHDPRRELPAVAVVGLLHRDDAVVPRVGHVQPLALGLDGHVVGGAQAAAGPDGQSLPFVVRVVPHERRLLLPLSGRAGEAVAIHGVLQPELLQGREVEWKRRQPPRR